MSYTKKELGTLWFSGEEPQQHMFDHASSENHQALIVRMHPEKGYRSFGSYRSWSEALPHLKLLDDTRKHFFEIMMNGRPCKPYFDFDHTYDTAEEKIDRGQFISEVEKALRPILSQVSNLDEETISSSFVWSDSSSNIKFSLHLIIHLELNANIWLVENNIKAGFLCEQLMLPIHKEFVFQSYIDQLVYTKNRNMRLPGATKFGKTERLRLIGNSSIERSIITFIPSNKQVKFLTIPSDYEPSKHRADTEKTKSIDSNIALQSNSPAISIFNNDTMRTQASLSFSARMRLKRESIKGSAHMLSKKLDSVADKKTGQVKPKIATGAQDKVH